MISVIIPFYNEKENLPVLINQLIGTFKFIKDKWEIVLVNDGSTDVSTSNIKDQISLLRQDYGGQAKINIKNQNEEIRIFNHRKRLGKGAALKTGIENSLGDIIVFMDGDLQDDPKDLPRFLKKIEEGYDFVNGIRTNRKDNILVKFYSLSATKFLQIFLHSPFTDINCGFKAFKKEILNDFILYGNNFRFLPLAAFYSGYRVTEISVNNRARRFGQSKFGTNKLFIGVLDTLTAYFLYKFSEKPLHFFGMVGGFLFLIGFLISFYLAIERIFFHVLLYRRPILQLGILLIIVGIQIIMTGIIGELIVYLNKKK
jgi:glycosyltransferase involved in cell wall biosynthesis